MKKIFFLLVSVLVAGSGFSQVTFNDAHVEKRNVPGFHALRISSAFEVFITQGNTEAVAVSSSRPEYIDHIKTTVENGVLVIRVDADKNFWKGWNGNHQKLRAYISVTKLDRLSVSGACKIKLESPVSAENLSLNFSGASDMKGEINAKNLTVDLSGASDIVLSGNAGNLKIEASGASDFKGYELMTSTCEVKASGASSISVTVNKELSVVASGASTINYKGEAMIREVKSSGASNVNRKS
jgi:hypothetical protein